MDIQCLTNKELFDFNQTVAAPLFRHYQYPWEVLPHIGDFIMELGKTLPASEYKKIGEMIWVHKTALVYESAHIQGPLIIGPKAEVRHCAFIRGRAIIGEGAVVGNSTEVKNSIIFNGAQCPHYNYIGDSIIGYKSHMGAGSITSNLKSDKTNVTIRLGDEKVETGLRKMGAMLGDLVEVGCGSVLNPGSVIGPDTNIYPLSMIRGYIPAHSIYKNQGEVATKC